MTKHADSLIDSLVEGLAPTPPMRARNAAFAGLVAMAATLFALGTTLGLRADVLAGRVDAMFVISTGLFLCLGAAATHAVVTMGRPHVGSYSDGWQRDGWIWAVVMAALLPLAAGIVALTRWLDAGATGLDAWGWRCLAYGSASGVLLAIVLVAWLRRGAPTSLARAGWLVGLAAGSAGTFVYALYCPDDDILHIGLWHVGAVVTSALLGRAVVPAFIRW